MVLVKAIEEAIMAIPEPLGKPFVIKRSARLAVAVGCRVWIVWRQMLILLLRSIKEKPEKAHQRRVIVSYLRSSIERFDLNGLCLFQE